jgi:hypothetical protein
MSKLTVEEIQKTLSDSMQSMQKMMEDERKSYKEKIKNLEETLKEKEEEIKDLKNQLISKKRKKEDKKLIENIQQEKELIQKEIDSKITEFKEALIEVSTLKNQLEIKNQEFMQIELEKNQANEKLKESEQKRVVMENQFFVFEKQIKDQNLLIKECNNNLIEKDKIIKQKDIDYNKLKQEFSQKENDYNGLFQYINELKIQEERLKKEREEVKIEIEKYNSLYQELIKEKEELKNAEIEKLVKQKEKEQEEGKEKDKNEDYDKEKENIDFEDQGKMIIDLLCEFLLKLNNLQYFISLFDLLDKSLKQYDELTYINNLNSSKHELMNDILYNFFESLKSFFLIQGETTTLNNFLLQKNFRLTEITKEDVEIIQRINSVRISKDINILEVYRKKRELFYKSKEFTFNVLKGKILGEKQKEIKSQNEFLQITKPPLELDINFDDIINHNYSLVKYQVHNIFSKLRQLTIHISNIPIFLIYSLIVNCHNLNTLKIIFINNESIQQNNINIDNLNDICPILLNYLKKLNSFSLKNLPLSSNKLASLIESLKLSKIKKLEINNCFQKKEDITTIIPYFSQNTLSEIDLSNHKFHIPSALNNSLLNYNINTQLTSIIFNNCQLNEEDIKSITNYVVSSSSLLLCDIGKNILSPLSCSTFGYCILKTTSLETLRINECGINGESLLFIFNGKGSKPLKHVNLNGNEFGDIGLVSISAFMKNTPLLESIELEKCGGTDMGFISLASMIQGNTNSKIKYVNFHRNNLTNASLGILKKFNDTFTNRKVVFALDKIENQGNNFDIDCAIFT